MWFLLDQGHPKAALDPVAPEAVLVASLVTPRSCLTKKQRRKGTTQAHLARLEGAVLHSPCTAAHPDVTLFLWEDALSVGTVCIH